jgi:hypothetical protein
LLRLLPLEKANVLRHLLDPMVARAKHLEGLGLTRKEAAELLGTTAPSLTEQYRQQKQKKGGKRGKKR